MVRIWIIDVALALALAMPATAQQWSALQILERLHALCDQDYKPACIKLGFVIGGLHPGIARKLHHPPGREARRIVATRPARHAVCRGKHHREHKAWPAIVG